MAKNSSNEVTGWVGWVGFAGMLAIVMGILQAIVGIVALFKNTVYAIGPENVWVLDYTTWGWVHLLWGAFLILVGGAILSGKTWGRVFGVILASISVIANFLFIPIYPFWSIIMVVVGVLVIFALTVHGKEIASLEE
ncbi:hypothetical protein KBC85_02785 [Candidatus Saccharibacteria bacterium]|nr:hypothetical protein [Candidatus Saccharibacteria bacterium]MDQ5885439.1 hypothetical protein [Patescibacteria group bacterium]MDQ5954024.1 hypothetical protein [Patescibacteria group bacterium]MDQ5958347.1 hypothetical protein [Patescibacteria group bacterium]